MGNSKSTGFSRSPKSHNGNRPIRCASKNPTSFFYLHIFYIGELTQRAKLIIATQHYKNLLELLRMRSPQVEHHQLRPWFTELERDRIEQMPETFPPSRDMVVPTREAVSPVKIISVNNTTLAPSTKGANISVDIRSSKKRI